MLKMVLWMGITCPPDYHLEVLGLMRNSLQIFFGLIILFHLLMYLGFWNDKGMSRGYIKVLTLFGIIGALFAGIKSISLGLLAYLIIVLAFMYLFVFLGLKYFPVQNKASD